MSQVEIATPFDRPWLVIGHRGAAGLAPENTLPSFEKAVALGVDAVELDVHCCADRLCVIHDSTLERTTNGSGQVDEQSLEQLRRLDAGGGAQIPFLEEVLEAVPATTGINVELKGAGTGAATASALGGASVCAAQLLVSSFDLAELDRFRALAPQFPVAPLFDRWRDDAPDIAERFGGGFINLSRRVVTRPRIEAIRAIGLRALVYTVNSAAQARRLLGIGVAGVFTDRPDRIIRAGKNTPS